MPIYCYYCQNCQQSFERLHSFKDKITLCEKCNCDGWLIRMPQMPLVEIEKRETNTKPGELTKKFIEESKEDLKQQKEEMKKEREK